MTEEEKTKEELIDEAWNKYLEKTEPFNIKIKSLLNKYLKKKKEIEEKFKGGGK